MNKRVLETGLEIELTEHLRYEKHAAEGDGTGNSRNGTRTKTVLTEVGPVEIVCPGTGRAPSSPRRSPSAPAVWRGGGHDGDLLGRQGAHHW